MTDTYQLIQFKNVNGEYHMAHNQQSIPPGRLQYNITPDIIHQISKDIPSHSDSPTDWKLLTALELQSIDIKRCLPKTATFGKKIPKSNFVLHIALVNSNNSLKYVLYDHITSKMCLLTSVHYTTNPGTKRAPMNSHDPDWKILRCKMIAPWLFWNHLCNDVLEYDTGEIFVDRTRKTEKTHLCSNEISGSKK
jgi:hypothetical protein